jgi:hypothetical protein
MSPSIRSDQDASMSPAVSFPLKLAPFVQFRLSRVVVGVSVEMAWTPFGSSFSKLPK